MKDIEIVPSQVQDIETIMAMYDHSRTVMRANGNTQQWVNGYPQREQLEDDIRLGHSFLILRNGKACATFAFIIGRDATYEYIEDGSWEADTRPYGTIHRLAECAGEHGIAEACLEWCGRQIPSLRADTHRDNAILQHILPRHGFVYRGIIYLADGSQRLAYQKLDTGLLCEPMLQYIDSEILPRYAHFDAAHRGDHTQQVIHNSLQLARHYPVEINMVYTIAAYHDIGLCEGRERHHIVSGELLRGDTTLRKWFDEKQISLMAEAVEDHRASAQQAPRSIYGKIVAEADRDIEPQKIVQRTVQYGLTHQPEADVEAQWQRTVEHLEEKYGEGGYLQLWLPESPNAAKLKELRDLIHNRSALRQAFENALAAETGR